MEDLDKLKDEEMFLDKLSSEASDYAYEAKDNDFDVFVRVTCVDGWVSCELIKPIKLS